MYMKKHISFFIILAVVSLLTACFSPWTGDSSITINLGRSMGRFDFEDESQIDGFEYNITLRGPGGTVTKHVKESGPVTFQVVPGNWTVDVRAIGDNPWIDVPEIPNSIRNKERLLRALGLEANIEVKAGANRAVPLEMNSAMEVSNWDELYFARSQANLSGKEEIILINTSKNEIEANYPVSISINSSFDPKFLNITLMSDSDVTLKRSPELDNSGEPVFSFPYQFFEIGQNATLTLGKPGMTGKITLDGGWDKDDPDPPKALAPLILVGNGTLVMNEGIKLINNYCESASYPAGGVYIQEGKFTMDGGEISGNFSYSGGGGVRINGGTFTMKEGTINLNETGEGGRGGGVYIENEGTFEMSGSAVIDNNKSYYGGGGGVFVEWGNVKMEGNAVIKNNKAYNGNGGGVYLWGIGPTEFKMLDSSIESNECLLSGEGGLILLGGGVYNARGNFNMSGGSITKNKIPEDGHGAGVCANPASKNNEAEIRSRTAGNFRGEFVDPDEQYSKYEVP